MNYKKFLNPHHLLFLILLSSSAYASTPSLEFGPFGQGIVDGTSPFGTDVEDTSGNLVACSSAASSQVDGADCGDNNHVLRSQDVAAHLFSISANGGDPTIPLGDNVVEDVVLEVTATPSADAVIVFDSMPTSCTTLGGGGTNPPSSIVTDANGSITLICNMGGLSEGQAKLLVFLSNPQAYQPMDQVTRPLKRSTPRRPVMAAQPQQLTPTLTVPRCLFRRLQLGT